MNHSDYTLLQQAAKSIGYRFDTNLADSGQLFELGTTGNDAGYVRFWNPLVSRSDALELAITKRIKFKFYDNAPPELGVPRAVAETEDRQWFAVSPQPDKGIDEVLATCRVITMAAAAMAL